LSPVEYTRVTQPEIEVYVWLPFSAFDSVWNVAPTLKSTDLQAILTLTTPLQGSALNYVPGDPDDSTKVWNAERENPLYLESTEFRIGSIKT
jgi:hypothetical protein